MNATNPEFSATASTDEQDAKAMVAMGWKILNAPLTDRILIDPASGKITVEKPDVPALVYFLDGQLLSAWTDLYGFWEGPARGTDDRAQAIRAKTLGFADVADRIRQAEAAFTELSGQLDAAKVQRDTVLNAFLDAIPNADEQEAILAAGRAALLRLARIAENDSGQAVTVRRFLLGLYNGHAWPFCLTSLRGLDKALFADCLDVLTLDARVTRQEVHDYLVNGEALFQAWIKLERGQDGRKTRGGL